MEIDHLCADRACVNPAHLELVTRQENLRRRNLENRFDLISENSRTRLLARRKVDENGCWRWPGAKVRGYGVMSVDGRTEYVHRLILRLDGVLDEEMTVDHLCRRIDCSNPDHLEQVTRVENTRRWTGVDEQVRAVAGPMAFG
jgi:hypothetical protein